RTQYAWSLLFLTRLDHPDQPREVLIPAARVNEALVEFLGLRAHRSIGADLLGSFLGKLQILQHQGGSEPALIIAVCRSFGADARNWTVGRHRPALARRL